MEISTKSLRNILASFFLLFCTLTIGVFTASARTQSSESSQEVILSPEEQAWLAEHPDIAFGIPTTYPPLVIEKTDGSYVGMLVDLFDQIDRSLNSNIYLHIEKSWPDIQDKAQNREIDGLALGGTISSRDSIYNATDIVLTTYFSVFARSQNEYQIKQLADIDGLRIGCKVGSRPVRSLLEKLPAATIKTYDDNKSLTQALLSKEVDVVVAWMSYDHWRKERLQGTIDNILLITEYPIEMVTYIRNDWPEMIPIFNKVLAHLQKDELPRITNKWFGEWPQLSYTTRISLTPEEQAWLDKNHKVRVRVADAPPWEVSTPEPQGMSVDYLTIIGNQYGIDFQFLPGKDTWFEGFNDVTGEHIHYDLLPVAEGTEEGLEYIAMSEPYLSSPYVIFTRDESRDILRIEDLQGKKVVVERGYVTQKWLEKLEPEIEILIQESTEEALLALSTGNADAYIGNLIVTSHMLQQHGISNIKVACPSPFGDHNQVLVTRKEWTPLISIIDKALASIPEEDKTAIRNKYLSVKYEQVIDQTKLVKWIIITAAAALSIILLFLFWNRRLIRMTAKWKDAEEKLLTTFENLPVGLCVFDLNDSVDHFKNAWYLSNKRFVELTGYTDDELETLGHWMERAYPDEDYRKWVWDTWEELTEKAIRDGTTMEAREWKVTCKDGHVADMEIVGHLLGDRYVATFIDQTERNSTLEALRVAKEEAEAATRAKSTFLASMSHELRTPLNAILGFTRLLSRDATVKPQQLEQLKIINRSGEHLLHMISDILTLSKIEIGRVDLLEESFDFRQTIEDVALLIQSRADGKGLSFNLELPDNTPPFLKGDANKLRQVLINLLDNAVKYTEEGQVRLSVTTEVSETEPEKVMIQCKVEDSGMGINPHMLQEIFDPFFRAEQSNTTHGGVGLGLSISKSLVDMMGGTIQVESELNKGSRFIVNLAMKLAEDGIVAPDVQVYPEVVGLKDDQPDWRILVVDDNRENLQLLTDILTKAGFTPQEAGNGKEAITKCKEWQPHFIWMDIRMPGMDGYETTRRIRELPGGDKIKIVAVTASVIDDQKQNIKDSDIDDVILKPFRDHEIFDVMARELGIEYIYRDHAMDAIYKEDPALNEKMLADLPSELLKKLNRSTLVMDREATLAVINKIEKENPEIASQLNTLVQDFRMGHIRELLKKVKIK